MADTNVNAYKLELAEAVAEAKTALNKVRDSANRLAQKQTNDADATEADKSVEEPAKTEDDNKDSATSEASAEAKKSERTAKQQSLEPQVVPPRPSTAGHTAPTRSVK